MLDYILKIIRTIDGSNTIEMMNTSYKMLENFIKVYNPKDQRIVEDLRKYYSNKYKVVEENYAIRKN